MNCPRSPSTSWGVKPSSPSTGSQSRFCRVSCTRRIADLASVTIIERGQAGQRLGQTVRAPLRRQRSIDRRRSIRTLEDVATLWSKPRARKSRGFSWPPEPEVTWAKVPSNKAAISGRALSGQQSHSGSATHELSGGGMSCDLANRCKSRNIADGRLMSMRCRYEGQRR